MDKWLRTITTVAVSFLIVPVVGGVLHDSVQQPLVALMTGWLSSVAQQWWYWYAVVAGVAFWAGVWLDGVARQFDQSRQTVMRDLAQELGAIRDRLRQIIVWHDNG